MGGWMVWLCSNVDAWEVEKVSERERVCVCVWELWMTFRNTHCIAMQINLVKPYHITSNQAENTIELTKFYDFDEWIESPLLLLPKMLLCRTKAAYHSIDLNWWIQFESNTTSIHLHIMFSIISYAGRWIFCYSIQKLNLGSISNVLCCVYLFRFCFLAYIFLYILLILLNTIQDVFFAEFFISFLGLFAITHFPNVTFHFILFCSILFFVSTLIFSTSFK